MIKFSCKNCAQQISVEDKHSGRRGKCPKCGQVVVVPDKSTIVTFQCGTCGRKINVSKMYAGKKGKCPKCNIIFVIPKGQTGGSVAIQAEPASEEITPKVFGPDPRLFDMPQEKAGKNQHPGQQVVPDKTLENLHKLRESFRKFEPEPVPERKLPWIIDILLYPINKSGLTMLLIFIGIPLFMEIFVKGLFLLTRGFPPFYVFALLFLIISLLLNITIRFYRYWYLSECIRDSADGQIRASETIANTPGLWELFIIFLRIYICIIVLSAPVYYYLLNSRGVERSFSSLFSFTIFFLWIVVTEVGKGGITFHVLLFFAVFLFPMTILSVVMFGSLRGLNPVLVLRSLLCTFVPYCGLIVLLCVLWLPVILMRKFIVTEVVSGQAGLLLYLPRTFGIYLMLVGSHLLGRFYWKYQEKLNWEV
jgi:DNA-directed RNA polymerase subunit RPC12/RpoP